MCLYLDMGLEHLIVENSVAALGCCPWQTYSQGLLSRDYSRLLASNPRFENFSSQNQGISPKETLKIPSSEATFGQQETLASVEILRKHPSKIDFLVWY
jgi:hypothetical protein